jgi:hypothetical protein
MKLYEAMKLLDEDSTRKFECQDRGKKWLLYTEVGTITGLVYYQLDCWDNNGELKTGTAFGSLHGNLTTSDNWQLVPQPVTWQEAIQAWADGKVVYVENEAGGRVYRSGGEGEKMYLLHSEITKGAWYVEG